MSASLAPLQPQGPAEISYLTDGGGRLPASGDHQQTQVRVQRVISALKRYRWLIVICTAAGLAGGVLASRFLDPEYVVGATIWIETPSRGKEGTPIQGEELLQSRAWLQLLRTYAVLDPVVRGQKLYISAAHGPDSALFAGFELADRFLPGGYALEVSRDGRTYSLRHETRVATERGAIGDSVGRTVGFLWQPRPRAPDRGRTIEFSVVTPREASQALNDRLGSTLREDNFLSVRLSGPNAKETETTLNALIRRFVDEAALQKRQNLTLLAGVLDTQVTNQQQRLHDAEEQLEGFRVSTVTQPREETPVAPGLQFTQPTVYGTFFAMRRELDDLRRDREAIEDVLRRSQAGEVTVDAFNTIQAVRSAPDLGKVLGELSTAEAELRTQRLKYTDEYKGIKDLQEKIQTLRTATIPTYVSALVSQLRQQETDLNRRITTASRELTSIPVRSQTEARFRREVEQAEMLYKNLESNRQQARLAEASAIPDVRILDSAEAPANPTENTAPRLVLFGLALGLGLGLGLAVLLDMVDRRFRYPEQVTQDMGLAILGAIPRVKPNGRPGGPTDVAQVIEAFRSVRLNLAHSFQPGETIRLVVSSPGPGDGKSLVSSNLALSFAEAGYHTVLIDGDIRRGTLHRTFPAERRPGLLDYLAGDAELADILRATTHARLALVPSGNRRHGGPELLGSSRMNELLARLRDQYGVIVVDSPPLGAGTDPFVLATATGNLTLVLRAGETDRQLAEAKLQVIDRLPIRLIGAILNDVRVGEGAYRYYAYSYAYAEEDPALPAPRGEDEV